MTARTSIVAALVTKFKGINGVAPYNSKLWNNVSPKLIFWDEVTDYPTLCVTAGVETRDYLPGDFKWGFLNVNTRIYVEGDDAQAQLEDILGDLEMVIDANNELEYETGKSTTEIRITKIYTDEGLLLPQGVGEFLIQVRYEIF